MPTALGTSSFIVKVTDSDSLPNADTKLLSIVINLATPTLIAPEDSTIINDDTPTFVWSSTTGEYGSYTLEYTPDSTFASGVVTVSNLTDTIYTVYDTSTLSDTTYWWHVEAVKWPHSSGYQKHPSMFTVDTKVPETPILILPKDSLITNCDTIIFLWSAPEEGLHYLLQCATDVDYNLVLDTLLIDTTLTVILSDATYYWHVKAIDRAGNESEYQEHHFTFTIDTDIPNTPVLISPANSSYVNVSTPTFIWSNAILKCSDESSNLLMDEPFGHLDAQTRYLMQIEIMRIWEKQKKTVVFITNNIEEAVYLASRIFVLSKIPARIKGEYKIDLPRPRDLTSPEFLKIRAEITEQSEVVD